MTCHTTKKNKRNDLPGGDAVKRQRKTLKIRDVGRLDGNDLEALTVGRALSGHSWLLFCRKQL